jgi:hypothetical protein
MKEGHVSRMMQADKTSNSSNYARFMTMEGPRGLPLAVTLSFNKRNRSFISVTEFTSNTRRITLILIHKHFTATAFKRHTKYTITVRD